MKVKNKILSAMLVIAILSTMVVLVPVGAAESVFYDDFSTDTLSNYTLVNCDSTATTYGTVTIENGTLTVKAAGDTTSSAKPEFCRTVSGSSNLIIEYLVKAGGATSAKYSKQGVDLYFGSYGNNKVELLANDFYNPNTYKAYEEIKVIIWIDFTKNSVKTYVDGVEKNNSAILADGIAEGLLSADKVICFNQQIKGNGHADYNYIAVYEMPSEANVSVENSSSVALNSMDIEINVPIDVDNSEFKIGDTTATAEKTGLNTYTLTWENALEKGKTYTLNSSLKVLNGSNENVSTTTNFTTTDGYSFEYLVYDNGFTTDSFAQYSKYSISGATAEDTHAIYNTEGGRLISSTDSTASSYTTGFYKTINTDKKFVVDYIADSYYNSNSRYSKHGVRVYRADKFVSDPKNDDYYREAVAVSSWNQEIKGDRQFTSVVDLPNSVYSTYVDGVNQNVVDATFNNGTGLYNNPIVYFTNYFKGSGAYVDYKYIAIYEVPSTLDWFIENKDSAEVKKIVIGFNMPVDVQSLKSGVTVGGKTVVSAEKLSVIDEKCANYYSLELNEKLDFATEYSVNLTDVKSIDNALSVSETRSIKTMASGALSLGEIVLEKRTANSATAEVNITNTTGEKPAVTLILATYKNTDGVEGLVDLVPMTFEKAISGTLTATISTKDAQKVRAFVWDSLSNLKPLSNVEEINAE
ncbi:MAG: hypothetical protein E7392_00135 [Ruminococcaceae bacterium]|nr:hypothetical protein [Oscillospiraceae bacterium]